MSEKSAVRYTPEQLASIQSRGQDILLSAAAGSGKTAVLVARILSLILEGGDIERMLVLTFTRAAAAQMRSRLGEALIREAKNPDRPQAEQKRLYSQALKLPGAQVSTLHSACIQILRRHFASAGIDPDFRIADPAEIQLIEEAAMEELMAQEHDTASPAFLHARACYSPRWGDRGLRKQIMAMYGFMQSLPHGAAHLRTWITAMEQGDQSFVMSMARDYLQEAVRLMDTAITTCDLDPGFEGHARVLSNVAQRMEELLALPDEALFAAAQQKFTYDRFPAKRGLDEGIKAAVTAARDGAKRAQQQAFDLLGAPGDASQAAPALWELLRLTTDFEARVQTQKLDSGVLGFNDLELMTLQALEAGADEDVRAEVDFVFVDEYQDISHVQEAILTRISPPGGRFDVGDVKQSIYRFRLAAPDLFLGKYHDYPDDANAPRRRILLNHNFRSRPCVLDAVNGLFTRLMDARTGELDYGEAEALRPGLLLGGTLPPGGGVSLCLVEGGENEELFGPMRRAQLQAQAVATKILALEGTAWYDPKDKRTKTLTASDIAVLIPRNAQRAVVLNALDNAGIACAPGQSANADTPERISALSLLSLVDNPQQDVPLLTALTTRITGFSLEELAAIRKRTPEGALHQAIHQAKEEDSPQGHRLKAFFSKLDRWRAAARTEPVGALTARVLAESGLQDDVGILPGGAARLAALDTLVDEAEAFSADRGGTLRQFLQVTQPVAPAGEGGATGEGEGVKVLTIHQSKGLEFPVVIVMGIEGQFNLQDSREEILYHRALGLGPTVIDPIARTVRDTPQRRALSISARKEAIAEQMRLLYVAMTRARDQLILMGAYADVQKALEQASKRLPESWSLSQGDSFSKWLLPFALRHPNAQALRSFAGLEDFEIINDDAPWTFEILTADALAQPPLIAGGTGESQQIHLAPPVPFLSEYFEDAAQAPDAAWVAQRLDYVYPLQALTRTPAKVTVSALAREAEIAHRSGEVQAAAYYPPPQPKFLSEAAGLSAAERGTAVHALMKHLDYRLASPQQVLAQVQTLYGNGILSQDEAAAIPVEAISRFLQSPLGQQMAQADLQREIPFTLMVPAAQAGYPDCAQGEIMLQGVIDAFFQQGDSLVLVDFKTDRIDERFAAQAAEKHRTQIGWYARALQQLMKLPVKQMGIVFLSAGVDVLWQGE